MYGDKNRQTLIILDTIGFHTIPVVMHNT